MKILFIGDDWLGSNARSLRDAFLFLGHDVSTVSTGNDSLAAGGRRELLAQLLRSRSQVQCINDIVQMSVKTIQPELVVVFRGNCLALDTVEVLRDCCPAVLHYHPDDIENDENVSASFLAAIPAYTVHVTTKTFNVQELRTRGAVSVLYVPCAYDPWIHRPVGSTGRYDACFVGTARPERVAFIRKLARRGDLRLRVAGHGWYGTLRNTRGVSVSGPVTGLYMSAVINASAVSLSFLNHQNRDLHTCRTFEIPACGGAVLAERSAEQMEFFRDGLEARYFSDFEEMVSQTGRLLANAAELRKLAANAQARALELRATYVHRACEMLDHVRAILA